MESEIESFLFSSSLFCFFVPQPPLPSLLSLFAGSPFGSLGPSTSVVIPSELDLSSFSRAQGETSLDVSGFVSLSLLSLSLPLSLLFLSSSFFLCSHVFSSPF